MKKKENLINKAMMIGIIIDIMNQVLISYHFTSYILI